MEEKLKVFDDYFVEYIEINGYEIEIKDEEIREVIQMLNEKEQLIILYYYYLSMSDNEISRTLNEPRSTVWYKRQRALMNLKNAIITRRRYAL